jgi:hypothetical protein
MSTRWLRRRTAGFAGVFGICVSAMMPLSTNYTGLLEHVEYQHAHELLPSDTAGYLSIYESLIGFE